MSPEELGIAEENGGQPRGWRGPARRPGQCSLRPLRVRMLGMIADGRSCCDFSSTGVPADEGDQGICVCEFEEHFGMGQSKVSYHMKKLKDAGLMREKRRGKWAFYSLDRGSQASCSVRPRIACSPVPRSGALVAAESGDRARVLFLCTHN